LNSETEKAAKNTQDYARILGKVFVLVKTGKKNRRQKKKGRGNKKK